MNQPPTNPSRNRGPQRLAVEWLEKSRKSALVLSGIVHRTRQSRKPGLSRQSHASRVRFPKFLGGFTILELMVVIGIIGFMTALALPHLSGFTRSNSVTVATRQMLDEVALARQRALVNRSEVDMVFLPSNFWTNNFRSKQITNLLSDQYIGYALISWRTVGDQPGQHIPHYLTDWRTLPQGVFFAPFQFNNNLRSSLTISTTNTTTGLSNAFTIGAFSADKQFPFPSTVNTNASFQLPYIGFLPNGQLYGSTNQYIVLDRGSIFYPADIHGVPVFVAPDVVEAPPGNVSNNPVLISIDWLTARAKVQRNQF